MTSQIRSARFRGLGLMSRATNEQTSSARGLSQLIPVALALYLTPVLLIVLVVGGIGMVVLAFVRTFTARHQEAGQSASHFWSDEEPSHLNSTLMPADEEAVRPMVVTDRGPQWRPYERMHEEVFAS